MAYVWGLDLIRFAAALMVVFFHLSWQQTDAQILFDPGWIGVEVFFIISGFVIIGSAGKSTPIEFLEGRFARLYPAAIACALISFALFRPFEPAAVAQHLYFHATLGTLVRSMVLLKGPYIVSALWTLPIELAFYALILLILIFRQIHRVTLVAGLLIVVSGLYLAPLVITEYNLTPSGLGPNGLGALILSDNLGLLRHGCFFGVGMLIWQVLNRRPQPNDRVLLVLGMMVCWLEIIGKIGELKPVYTHPIRQSVVVGEALLVFTAAVLAIWLAGRFNARIDLGPSTKRVLRRIGLITFPLYLLHESVGGSTFGLLRERGDGQGVALLCGLSLTLLVSLLVIEFIEPWFRRRLLAIVHPILLWLTATTAMARVLGSFRPGDRASGKLNQALAGRQHSR